MVDILYWHGVVRGGDNLVRTVKTNTHWFGLTAAAYHQMPGKAPFLYDAQILLIFVSKLSSSLRSFSFNRLALLSRSRSSVIVFSLRAREKFL